MLLAITIIDFFLAALLAGALLSERVGRLALLPIAVAVIVGGAFVVIAARASQSPNASLDELNRGVTDLDRRVAELNRSGADLNRRVAELNRSGADLNRRVGDINRGVDDLN